MEKPITYELYVRKSQEPDDRQVLSIPAQLKECRTKFADLNIARETEESFSAKSPGRKLFSDMIKRVEEGKVQGLIAWHPDRLARNSVDSGQIIHLLDTGKLKDLKFASYTFENTPEGKWMLAIVMSQAKYFVDKLSKDVKRGNRQKYESGGITWKAPQGYVNNKAEHSIEPDPERYLLVEKMWRMLLSGSFDAMQILRIANEDWKYLTRKTKKEGGKPLTASLIYKMFNNPLYYGINIRPDGTEYKCGHVPMITPEEFWRAQSILGRKGKRRPQKHDFSFTGLIRCAECGCSFTAYNREKTTLTGVTRVYAYYRCSKKRGPCSQSPLTDKDLDSQIDQLLSRVEIPDAFIDWAMKYLRHENQREQKDVIAVLESQQRQLASLHKKLGNLVDMRASGIIDDLEFAEHRKRISSEKASLEELLDATTHRAEKWIELAEHAFEFASRCRESFKRGTNAEKRQILVTICGSNLHIRDKKLELQPVGLYKVLAERTEAQSWQGYEESNLG